MKSSPKTEHKYQGMSLLELMVALALIAVIAALAIPRFGQMKANQALKSAAEKLNGDLVLARVKAIEKGSCYTISFDASKCGNCSSCDYCLIKDDNCNGQYDSGGSEKILSEVSISSLWSGVTLSASGSVIFGPRGLPQGLSGETITLTNRYSKKIQLTISPLGGVKIGEIE